MLASLSKPAHVCIGLGVSAFKLDFQNDCIGLGLPEVIFALEDFEI
jgi:hypothetical protein